MSRSRMARIAIAMATAAAAAAAASCTSPRETIPRSPAPAPPAPALPERGPPEPVSSRGCVVDIVLPPRFVNGTVDVTFTRDALSMVAGVRRIEPDEDTRRAVGFAGVVELAASFEICSDADGAPSKVTLIRSTEHPAYDRTLEEGIRRWRFVPREVRGKYVPSCMEAQFTYRPWRD